MIKKLIIFLIRRRLGLKKFERFTFFNQKSNTCYLFTDDSLIKIFRDSRVAEKSNVSLNWLLSDECEIFREETI